MDLEKIEKLHELKEKGILSDEEFEKEKQKLLQKYRCYKNTNEFCDLKEDCSSLGIVKGSFCAAISALKRWKDFKGRTTRFDFWGASIYLYLFSFVCTILFILFLDMLENEAIEILLIVMYGVLSIFVFIWIPVTLYIRRLHDVNMSGWWCLAIIVPIIVQFIKGCKEENKFGKASKSNEDRALTMIFIQICISVFFTSIRHDISSYKNSISNYNNNYNSQYRQPSYRNGGYYH